jgi:SAM-dependent methyltransferase
MMYAEYGLRQRQKMYEFADEPHIDPFDVALKYIPEWGSHFDAGCGNGRFLSMIRNKWPLKHIEGGDISPEMVEATRSLGITAEVSDAMHLRWPDASFDTVSACFMLYALPDICLGLKEMCRVLKPDGKLIVVTIGKDHRTAFFKPEMEKILGEMDLGQFPDMGTRFNADNGLAILAEKFDLNYLVGIEGGMHIPVDGYMRWLMSLSAFMEGKWGRETTRKVMEKFSLSLDNAVSKRTIFENTRAEIMVCTKI